MPFEAFAESDYRRFWTTQFISNVGSWMQTVAQGWLVYRLTDSAFLLGFVGFASSAPAIVLMLPGGVLADQLNRKRVVAISQMAQALTALFLAFSIYFHRITVWQIVAAAVADRSGPGRLQLGPNSYTNFLSNQAGNDGVEIETVALDDLMRQGQITKPDCIKLDIEGAEADALLDVVAA